MIKFTVFCFAVINIFSAAVTVYDKRCAKMQRRRISEDFLLTSALLGGALCEYITMKVIRHKTKHKKFMIALPLIIVLQLTALIAALYINYFR